MFTLIMACRDAKIKELRGELSRALDEIEGLKALIVGLQQQAAGQSAILGLLDPGLLAQLLAQAKADGNAQYALFFLLGGVRGGWVSGWSQRHV